ncbi:MAG: type I-C CRISPR-associated protein Cas8c/Csd1 [Clostridia bacterium]
MSWMQKLYDVYVAAENDGLVGKQVDEDEILLPIYHMTVQAGLEVTISPEGDFLRADVIENKADRTTIIPCTEAAASRTSNPIGMPLSDKLLYIAGDCGRYFPPMKKKEGYPSYHEKYTDELRQWCESGLAHEDVQSWYRYVQKGCLMNDLIAYGVLAVDENGLIPLEIKGKEKPPIYRTVSGDLLGTFVRIRVSHDGEARLWMNSAVHRSFIAYQESMPSKKDICYVSGQCVPISTNSPKFIRCPGDGAKLISSNEKSFLVFRGRFACAKEALSLGREMNEKAHNALKWLILRQGWYNDGQVILTFADGGKWLPSPAEDVVAMNPNHLEELGMNFDEPFTTEDALAKKMRQAFSGYGCRISANDAAVVIGLDSTIHMKGRLSIFYYREMRAEDMLQRVCRWHSSCAWRHNYRYVKNGVDEKGKQRFKRITFTGAPAPIDIVKAAYGENVSDKLLKNGVERLLSCIVDGAALPIDLMKNAARRAAQRGQLSPLERDKALSIACALIRKWHNDRSKKEEWTMALQTEVEDRSYLFGRALAYAEQIEKYALQGADDDRPTNAERLMVAFTKHPAQSWMVLMQRLAPYQQRLGKKAMRLTEEMEEIIARLQTEGFTNTALTELYCLGYACQKQCFADERKLHIQKKSEEKKHEFFKS